MGEESHAETSDVLWQAALTNIQYIYIQSNYNTITQISAIDACLGSLFLISSLELKASGLSHPRYYHRNSRRVPGVKQAQDLPLFSIRWALTEWKDNWINDHHPFPTTFSTHFIISAFTLLYLLVENIAWMYISSNTVWISLQSVAPVSLLRCYISSHAFVYTSKTYFCKCFKPFLYFG